MFTVILHDAPYTTERSWNGLRFAEKALDNGTPVCVFLFSDAVDVARKGQCPQDGTPNLEDLLIKLVGKGATVSVCTTCVEARPYQPSGQSAAGFFHTKESGLDVGDLVAGVKMGTTAELVNWCRGSRHVVSF